MKVLGGQVPGDSLNELALNGKKMEKDRSMNSPLPTINYYASCFEPTIGW